MDIDATKKERLDQYLYSSEAMITAAQILLAAGSPSIRATELCNLALARIKTCVENNQRETLAMEFGQAQLGSHHLEVIDKSRMELLTSQLLTLSKMMRNDINIIEWVLKYTEKMPYNYQRARRLSEAAQILTNGGESQKGLHVLQIALHSAMLAGHEALLDTLAKGASTLAAIDQGHTLWQIYEAILEIEGWWSATISEDTTSTKNIKAKLGESETSQQQIKNVLEQVDKIEKKARTEIKEIKVGDLQISKNELSLKEIILKGNEYYYRNEFNEAISWYDKALEIDKNNFDIWYNKGYALYILKRYEFFIRELIL
jgi:tetratricopeptide (TPR) repeat protein